MKKYYDLSVSFEDTMCYFYEWDEDNIEVIRTIPFIRVNKKVFKNILTNKIALDKEELEQFKDNTILLNGEKTTAILLCDTTNAFVLEFNSKGEEISISTLLVEDELEINELSYSMKNYDLNYDILEPRVFNSISKKDIKVKNYLLLELEELMSVKNESKLFYLYCELFHKKCSDFLTAYNAIKESINEKIKKEHYYLYELLTLKHKKSGLSN